METRRIICLANSYKHSNRCVAGIDVATRKWIRPISHLPDGSLEPRHYHLNDGSEARLLDVIDIHLDAKCARGCHPEDWLLSDQAWSLVSRPLDLEAWKVLEASLSKTANVLDGCRDRISASVVKQRGVARSLTLVRPDDLWWWIRKSSSGRKYRALFRQDRVRYDLALTDPAWLAPLKLLPEGLYEHSTICGGSPPETLLTISLSEEFDRFHYKLVAGVVIKPSAEPASVLPSAI